LERTEIFSRIYSIEAKAALISLIALEALPAAINCSKKLEQFLSV
jgi:hypothetical protein